MVPAAAQGDFRGTNDLWLEDPGEAERSEATAHVTVDRVEYTWSFRGKPQRGRIDLREASAGGVRAEWTDTWHSERPMTCTGPTAEGGRIGFAGTYRAGEGPDWGWRTELETGADRFVMRMWNVTPEGEESRAVEMICTR